MLFRSAFFKVKAVLKNLISKNFRRLFKALFNYQSSCCSVPLLRRLEHLIKSFRVCQLLFSTFFDLIFICCVALAVSLIIIAPLPRNVNTFFLFFLINFFISLPRAKPPLITEDYVDTDILVKPLVVQSHIRYPLWE